ncbi:MAG TPA: asparagine synthase (glutamine-hydrolyzing) [Burkholderiales bacterium]|nr:asparagine synthase (glutamine-hydrolyzing) [Burkholderiales bacterium]
MAFEPYPAIAGAALRRTTTGALDQQSDRPLPNAPRTTASIGLRSMCGIAGIIGNPGERTRAALRKLSAALAHRGPDGDGYWESSPDGCGRVVMLAHRRLSILDVSSAGAQPMVDAVTGDVVVFNGEIYNYVALRDQLLVEGQTFQSSGDTEVMLRALSIHGRDVVASLRGMFAFAMWDSSERKLLLARDPLGIKPLYFARNPDPRGEWSLVFASEVRAILACGLLGKPRLNPLAAASVVWNGFMVTPETVVAGIEAMWPGQIRVFDSVGNEELTQYYWEAMQRSAPEFPDEPAGLTSVLEDSVRLHLASDVPLGVFLSGGVDSASVANLAQKASRAPVHTFTLAFEEQAYNEGPIARQIAAAIGTCHREVVLTEEHFVDGLEAALDSLDQPSFDGLNSYYMSHAVREAGFKVALLGTGGDELFGGYTSFRDLPTLMRWSRRMRWVPELVRVALARLVSTVMQPSRGPVPQQTRWSKLPDMVQRGDDLLSLYQLAYALFLPGFQRELLGNAATGALVEGLPPVMRSRLLLETGARSPLSAISLMEHRLFLGERLLRDTDAVSMSASIELRLPLVDSVSFEYIDRLRDQDRYMPLRMKSILRRIGLRGLDPALFAQQKKGFVLPFDRWIRTGLGKVMDRTLRDPEAVGRTGLSPDAVARLWRAFLDGSPGIYWSRVWAIYVFVYWCRRHRVQL